MKQLILSGGGDVDQTKELDQFYISLLPENPKIFYVPTAWNSGNSEGCYEWFSGWAKSNGVENFEMVGDLSKITIDDLQDYDSIYIGGGNTFYLLHTFRESGFEKVLKEFIELGKPVYGGSAGAIIFGKSIATAGIGKDSDRNDVETEDFSGLNLVEDYTIQCHFEDDQTNEHQKWSKDNNLSVIAIGESSGIYVTDSGVKSIGEEVVYFES